MIESYVMATININTQWNSWPFPEVNTDWLVVARCMLILRTDASSSSPLEISWIFYLNMIHASDLHVYGHNMISTGILLSNRVHQMSGFTAPTAFYATAENVTAETKNDFNTFTKLAKWPTFGARPLTVSFIETSEMIELKKWRVNANKKIKTRRETIWSMNSRFRLSVFNFQDARLDVFC